MQALRRRGFIYSHIAEDEGFSRLLVVLCFGFRVWRTGLLCFVLRCVPGAVLPIKI